MKNTRLSSLSSCPTSLEIGHRLTHVLSVLISVLFLAGCGGALESETGQETALLPFAQKELAALGSLPLYKIAVEIYPDRSLLTGQQRLVYINSTGHPQRELCFRLYPNLPAYGGKMQISQARVDGKTTIFSYEAEHTALRLTLPEPLPPGREAGIELVFSLEIPEISQDRIRNTPFGYGEGILCLPDFYPLMATCGEFEIPPGYADAVCSEVALYEVNVTAPDEMVVVTSGRLASSSGETIAGAAGGERSTRRYLSGPMRNFALVMSADFQKQSTTAQGTTVNSYSLPNDVEAGRSALWYAAAALRVYCDLFGPYPYIEMDVVEVPLGRRGMEYPGLVMLGAELYRSGREGLEFLAAHEVAHQWWYGLVGSDPVRHPWLDEGLAEHSTFFYYWYVHGPASAQELLKTRWQTPYSYAVDAGLDGAVAQTAEAFGDNDTYELLAYAKAALFFDALRQALGDRAYLALLRRYLQEYKYRLASPQDFLDLAQEMSSQDLNPIYQQWLQQK